MSENASVEEILDLIRQPLLEIHKLDERQTFDSVSDELAESYEQASEKYIEMSRAALLILDERIDPSRRALLPLLEDESIIVRLNVAGALMNYFPQQARATLIELAELEPRLEPELDITHVSTSISAQFKLWLMQHGTIEGWAQAPERFWRK